jgi:tRNA modification GTPase
MFDRQAIVKLRIFLELYTFAPYFLNTYIKMITELEDTIVALATPPGVGAISVIRISGRESFKVVSKIFSKKDEILNAKTHTIHYGNIVKNNEIIDDVIVLLYREPHSYTGEDSIEINTHGSPIIVQKIISLLIDFPDIRLAEPGEFTKRAFLNNRMDLTQAEAVADLINSRTEVSIKGARNQLNGVLSSKINDLRQDLMNILSFIELELDFSEENIEFVKKSDLLLKFEKLINEIQSLLNTYNYGRVVRNGLNVAIVGETNVGKSSIMNYLLKESRSIVSNIPGTTRDIIREEISIEGLLFKLFDTAGIRKSNDEVEVEGVNRSISAIQNADIILFIGDVESGFSEFIEEQIDKLNSTALVRKVLNKVDLNNSIKLFSDFRKSALTGEGMADFIKEIRNSAQNQNAYTEKDVVVSDIRHFNCLSKACENLKSANLALQNNNSGEYLASDLRAAELYLSEIIGEITPEEVLNNIFSKFCVGK